MIDMTDMERQAVKDARRSFAETLTELKLMEHFAHRQPEEIDALILSAINGFQQSMQRQSENGGIPL